MSQPLRQSTLFAAEDYLKVFRSFKDVNFTNYDFDGIKRDLLSYINEHYPEDFNDFVESSELIAIVDLLAFVTTSMALRTDMNTRENFLDTAERRDSVVRLARMLSYEASRNIPARGLLRVRSVSTSQDVYDSAGRNLKGTNVYWDDANNSDSIEQFTSILNAAFLTTNQFGRPLKSGQVGGETTELYAVNTSETALDNYSVDINVNGRSLPLNITNANFDDGGYVYERHPDPADPFHMLYVNDGQGTSSINNGFFLYFKQGSLTSSSFEFTSPVPNRILDINEQNINNQDVYFQRIDRSTQEVIEKWTKVPTDIGTNISYNGISASERKIYSEITNLNDTVSLKFSDGVNGEMPKGNYRVWYRQSQNENVIIRPSDASNIQIALRYIGKDQQTYTLTVTASLEYTVDNGAPSETTENIKQRAPAVYYTQNRMVNGEDYNSLPLQKGNEIEKLHAVNRTYAGHSRYVNTADPTGHVKNLSVAGDDGVLFIERDQPEQEIFDIPVAASQSNKIPVRDLLINRVSPFVDNYRLRNFFFASYLPEAGLDAFVVDTEVPVLWKTKPGLSKYNYGYLYFRRGNSDVTLSSQDTSSYGGILSNIKQGAALTFVNPNDSFDKIHVNVTGLTRFGIPSDNETRGPITLSKEVPAGYILTRIIPRMNIDFSSYFTGIKQRVDGTTASLYETISSTVGDNSNITDSVGINIIENIINTKSFGLGYDITEEQWYIIENIADPNADFEITGENSWLIYFESLRENNLTKYRVITRGDRYVFESYQQAAFFYDGDNPAIDLYTGRARRDQIVLTADNTSPYPSETWTGTVEKIPRYDSFGVLQSTETKVVWRNGTVTTDNIIVMTRPGNSSNVTLTKTGAFTNISMEVSNGFVKVSDSDLDSLPPVTDGQSTVTITYSDGARLGNDIIFNVVKQYLNDDGSVNNRRVEITPADLNADGVSENPLAFDNFVPLASKVAFESVIDYQGNESENVLVGGIVNITATSQLNLIDWTNIEFNGQRIRNIKMITMPDYSYMTLFASIVSSGAVDRRTQFTVARNFENKVVYVESEDTFYILPLIKHVDDIPDGETVTSNIVESTSYSAKRGRSFAVNTFSDETLPVYFRWIHYAPTDHRIDPSPSNIVDMYVLTSGYYAQVQSWKRSNGSASEFPDYPTMRELGIQFGDLKEYKMMSDEIVFRPAKFKTLFGTQANKEHQAKFLVVKIPGVVVSDNEIKTEVIKAIDEYFEISNWNFGDSFYYTELSAFIHQRLSTKISSVVIVPEKATGTFGDLFKVQAETNELFISTATVDNVEIVNDLTPGNMRKRS